MSQPIRRSNPVAKFGGVCLLSAVLTACSGGSGGDDTVEGTGDETAVGNTVVGDTGTSNVEQCSVADINRWVDQQTQGFTD